MDSGIKRPPSAARPLRTTFSKESYMQVLMSVCKGVGSRSGEAGELNIPHRTHPWC